MRRIKTKTLARQCGAFQEGFLTDLNLRPISNCPIVMIQKGFILYLLSILTIRDFQVAKGCRIFPIITRDNPFRA